MENELVDEKEQNSLIEKAILENAKNAYINQLAKELPDYLVGEAFADSASAFTDVFADVISKNPSMTLDRYLELHPENNGPLNIRVSHSEVWGDTNMPYFE